MAPSRIAASVLVALTTGCLIDNPLYQGRAEVDIGTDGGDATDGSTGSPGSGSVTGATSASASDSASASGSGSASASASASGSTTDAPGTSSPASTSADSAGSSGDVTTGNPNDPFCDAGDPDLIACYEFENDIEDGSSYGHDGSASNAGTDAGVRGLALSTDGNSEVRISNTAELQLVSALTVELWIFPHNVITGAFQHIVDKDRHYTTGIATDGHLRCRIPAGLIEAPFAVAENEWSHLACVFDGDTLTMYVNGTVAVQEPMQPQVPSTDRDLMLGSAADGGWPYDGLIDDLRIWSRPLSQQEICDAYGAC